MFHDTKPVRLDDHSGPGAWGPFRVDKIGETLAWLRQVRDAACPVVLAAPSGSALTCTLWSLDREAGSLVFSADLDQPQLHSLIDAGEAVAVTYLDNVKLQFELDDLVLVRGAASAALRSSMPVCMYRFQRRQSFRVRPAGRSSPKAALRHPAMPDMLLELRLLDVSAGGCAILLPADVPELRPGLVLHGVQVRLDQEARFVAGLQLHHVSSMHPAELGHRIGCEWRQLDPHAERALQRYVDQMQKRQRLMSQG